MSVSIVHVLCEGQTEAGFVKEVLGPYLLERKGVVLSVGTLIVG